jgi:OmpA-OmpF porin, OOP family
VALACGRGSLAVLAALALISCTTAPPPPAPPPPAPPPPAPPPRPEPPALYITYIVFFDFDKASLRPQGVDVVGEARKAAREEGMNKIIVTGHTDSVGSDRYNLALSLRRAEAVKAELVREGVDAASIRLEGKGSRDLLVPTGPGVREPQNRRVVIDLDN